MARKSGSKGTAEANVDEVVARLRADAAPALARALNLDSAEAVEAALTAGLEVAMAVRAAVYALPLPPEAREHLARAEAEALRAARMAAKGATSPSRRKQAKGAEKVAVEFEKRPKAAPKKRKVA